MSSALSEEDIVLKHFYQSNVFALEDDNLSNTDKADKLRRLLYFLEKLLAINRISETSYNILEKELSLQYHSILDNMDVEKGGLDNYSEMISVLTEGKKNESKHWVSHLSLDDECVKKVLTKNQGAKKDSNIKISFSNTTSSQKENVPSLDEKLSVKQNQDGAMKGQASHSQQNLLQESSDSQSANNLFTPRFGKRKQNFPEEVNKCEKKMQVNNVLYKNTNSSYEKKKIIYRHQDDVIANQSEGDGNPTVKNPFLTAGQQLRVDMKKSGNTHRPTNSLTYGHTKKSLGAKRGVTGKFVPPIGQEPCEKKQSYDDNGPDSSVGSKYEEFDWMRNIDQKMIEHVENEIMDHGEEIAWDDIAGLDFAKMTIQEIVVWPMLRPDLFTGLRGPPKGLLLFGPPGTGKTLIGKCIASQSKAKFFNISASSLTSKWIGDGEKMVRALFGVARCVQPAVIFIDEIDSLLTQRSDSEHESSRRLKTEFLVQLDGATALLKDRLLVVGATNRPQELDEAARRRLVKRLYIPLPDADARKHIIKNLMTSELHDLQDEDIDKIVEKSSGFSGADMANLCRDAALGPIRGIVNIQNINANEVRAVNITDFLNALNHVRPSVSQDDLQVYVDWNRLYGSGG